ncbi:MAG: TraX family protein [Planctomycetota bacterium]|jgi:hypothetical protein
MQTETALSHPPNHLDECKPGLRNAWQWIAMVTMLADHLGYWDEIAPLRAIGRLAMPLYCILFVISLRKNQVNGLRLLLIAAASQIPFMLYIEVRQLNIIFGFFIFYWFIQSQLQKKNLQMIIALAVLIYTGLPLPVFLPVSYGWYLYTTLFIFYRLGTKIDQRFAFAFITCLYVWMVRHVTEFPRQLIAIIVPFIEGIHLRRPNKYLYRYFYPGHLAILAIVKIIMAGSLMGNFYGFINQDLSDTDSLHEIAAFEPNDTLDSLDIYFWQAAQDANAVEAKEED